MDIVNNSEEQKYIKQIDLCCVLSKNYIYDSRGCLDKSIEENDFWKKIPIIPIRQVLIDKYIQE